MRLLEEEFGQKGTFNLAGTFTGGKGGALEPPPFCLDQGRQAGDVQQYSQRHIPKLLPSARQSQKSKGSSQSGGTEQPQVWRIRSSPSGVNSDPSGPCHSSWEKPVAAEATSSVDA